MGQNLIEKQLKSTEIYEGRILNLRIDNVKLPDGNEAKREIVEHAAGVTIIPYLQDTGEVIMVRQFRNPAEQILLEMPAGMLEINEEPKRCARRELEEETGYKAGDLKRIGSFYTSPGFCDERIHLYLAQNLSKYEQHTDVDEFLEVLKIPLEDLKNKLYTPEIIDAKTIIGVQFLLNYLQKD
ncbi:MULTISPECIES: NUDIX hydrolase [unclassified Candidatus Frackibacter]|uniref:NUDIX hydrolase n=1 Tax=unclassified Candidatus Frackibacter TaxID=2648818 RepID=UPI0008912131|nr:MULTISPECIES: NUDIX hydrolase [unclassified Candidatus Frackibacter]SDC02129.1 ADP-ribose pyrophosphatase [Candidatus Frackibacter sp. WG11]SEM33306.1 ADP-ribose pyrophosphatase [Candidatus Frackibacter sp. WG12]SFL38341.1 ADP-ribose pyrophosphatase [Candidatus Frackibacter sp. WG13]